MTASILALLLSVLVAAPVAADRAIPDDNLGYPVLITLPVGGSETFGSGFLLNTRARTYLVTAKHVLIDRGTNRPRAPSAYLRIAARLSSDRGTNRLQLDLDALDRVGAVRRHGTRDVVLVEIASVVVAASADGLATVKPIRGVNIVEGTASGVVGVAIKNAKKLDQVLVSNDVYLLGFPRSIGIPAHPQIDPERPLLSKGIVSALNPELGTLIVDVPVYPGNSGGPVLETSREGLGMKYQVIGVVTEFVPIQETWTSNTGLVNQTSSRVGYSVAVGMDSVFELLQVDD